MGSASKRGREKMGMKGECVCSTGGFWDEQNCWLCNCCIWVFNEPLSSCLLATELLLLAGGRQHKHVHKHSHQLHLQKFLRKRATHSVQQQG